MVIEWVLGVCAMSKQILKSVLYVFVAVLSVSVVSSSATAQLPPPVSPWMHMFDRPSNPALGNYLGNVRPQQNLMRDTASQAVQLQMQQQALQALQMQGSGQSGSGTTARNLTGAAPAAAPAGGATSMRDVLAPPREIPSVQRNPAGFNQYMHYYPPNSMPRRPVPQFSSTGRRR